MFCSSISSPEFICFTHHLPHQTQHIFLIVTSPKIYIFYLSFHHRNLHIISHQHSSHCTIYSLSSLNTLIIFNSSVTLFFVFSLRFSLLSLLMTSSIFKTILCYILRSYLPILNDLNIINYRKPPSPYFGLILVFHSHLVSNLDSLLL